MRCEELNEFKYDGFLVSLKAEAMTLLLHVFSKLPQFTEEHIRFTLPGIYPYLIAGFPACIISSLCALISQLVKKGKDMHIHL